MTKKTEILINAVRRTPLFRQLVPMEVGTGWPWPRRGVDHALYVAVPFFGVASTATNGTSVLHPPIARITVRWSTGLPVEYLNLRFDNPWPEGDWASPCGTFPHQAVADLDRTGYQALRDAAYGLYDQAFDCLDRGEPVPSEVDRGLASLLQRLVEPGLAPFYLRLAPAFFKNRSPVA